MLLALVAIIMPIGAHVQESVNITLAESSIATFYYSSSPFVIPEGISASVITGVKVNEDGTVTVTEEDVEEIIPAGCAVILRGTNGHYVFFEVFEEGNVPESNLLLGSDEPETPALPDEREYLYFTLDFDVESNNACWDDWVYRGKDAFVNQAHKAYLALPVDDYPGLLAMLETLENPHLRHTHGGCEICGQVTEVPEASWGATADALTSYGTLADAFAAAEEDSNIGYIKLLADVESTDGYTIEGADFTLDLNGQTIASENITLNIKSSTVTIEDNSEVKEGKVITSGYYAVSVDAGASVTINEGTYENTDFIALNVEGENSSVTINGGSYESLNESISISQSCFITITGGNFTSQASHAISTFGNLFINGGNFISAEEFEKIYYDGGKITFSEYDGLTSITVLNDYGERIVPSAETILLPEGYSFFYRNKVVSTLANGVGYSIGVEPAKYAVTFEANDGEGEMEGDNVYEGIDYTLPECTFTAPEGMMFKAWLIGDEEYQPYETIIFVGNTTIKALWTAYVPQIIIKMHDSYGDGWQDNAIVVKKNGEEIGIATIEQEEEEASNGIVRYDYDNTADYTFYWQRGDYPDECSFEIFIDDEEVFAAVRVEEEDNSDCENYEDGELIYTIEVKVAELESLTLVDGEPYSNTVAWTTVGTLTYTRTLPNLMWNALYVPFEIPLTELAENYDVAYINDIRSYDNDGNGEIDDMTMEIIRINSGTLNANHPYLIRAKNEEAQNMEIVLNDATLYNTEEISLNCSSMYMEFTITGTYNTLSDEDLEEKYAISTSGAWQKLSEGSSLKPFRLYMEMTPRDGSPVKVEAAALSRIRINMQGEDGNTTGVEILEAPQSINDAVLYDLYGRKVTTPVKGGIYISNGKKVIVK